jgi:aryl-alcohol dehydrogenase-like predicted oxidoreductase
MAKTAKTARTPKTTERRRGRPRTKAPADDGKSYVMTTFRMSKRAISEADTIKDTLGLSTRTAAVQFALGQMFKSLPTLSAYSPEEIRAILDRYLHELGEGEGR